MFECIAIVTVMLTLALYHKICMDICNVMVMQASCACTKCYMSVNILINAHMYGKYGIQVMFVCFLFIYTVALPVFHQDKV